MIDFHCHLDLYNNPLALIKEVEKRCDFVLAVTTSPRAWAKTSQVFSGIGNISVGLGLHPEILVERIHEKELFISNISTCSYLGEIGMDGSSSNRNSLSMQESFLLEIIKEAEKQGGKVMSLHSRNASKKTLQVIEKEINSSTPILHWFTGALKEVEWAISLGCWFSINPKMFFNKNGIEIVKRIPLSKIIPETDGPFTEHSGSPYMPWEVNIVLDNLSQMHRIPLNEIEEIIENNAKILQKRALNIEISKRLRNP